MTRYRNPALKQFADQQVRFAPREIRLAQIDRAEALLYELKDSEEYAYPELCRRITTRRTEMYPDLVISGEEAAHDLRLFVEELSDSANIDAAVVTEPVMTVEEVSKQFNVSTKTVDRWRARGLVSRRFLFGKRKRVGFLRSSVEHYVRNHADDVRRGAHFSQLSFDEKERIISTARQLRQKGMCAAEISRQVARTMGRSPETIRYTLKQFDAEHPDVAVFPNALRPLSDDQREQLYLDFLRNIPVERLAVRYGRTRTSIYRILAEIRAEKLIAQSLDFIDSPEFHDESREAVILGAAPQVDRKTTKQRVPPGLPPYLASLYNVPLLSREEEVYYFRKMNYLKFRASELRKQLDVNNVKARLMDDIEDLVAQSIEVKNLLIRSNLRLVVSIAKKHVKPTGNFFEMVSDGNMSLIRAIEKFDYTKGNKFSTYATWAIMKNYARSIPAEHTWQDRYRTGQDLLFQTSNDSRTDQYEQELTNQRQHDAIMGILGQLDERERQIIMFRYGLTQGTEPLTLEEVGSRFGVTKERIRQLESRAIVKMRKLVQSDKLDVPGL
ncbi:MAG: sigma-70 family RNA polymerase sigma factor [Planctomycetales bacterium]